MSTDNTTPVNTRRPIVDQYREWRQWNIQDLYLPGKTNGQIIPNVDDAVLDWSTNTIYRVISVNYANNTFTLQGNTLNKLTGYSTEDILTTSGPGDISEAFRIYINTDYLPYTLTFDSRVRVFGSQVAYVKVFSGNDTGASGNVISAMYDASGNKTSENIPLELVLMPDQINRAMKTPLPGYCSDKVDNGEILTAVFYTANGDVSSISRLVACNTNVVRTINHQERYVTNIDLISPYLSASDNTLLEYPLNMVIQSDSIMGRVTYSDGKSVILPIDGAKFKVLGMDSYIASEVGQVFALRLVYTLSQGEYAVGVSANIPDRSLSKAYRVQTIESDDTYIVKLFASPIWSVQEAKWDLEYYLYNIERNSVINVTSYVENGSQSIPFDGNKYDGPQNIVVAMNMLSLGSSYKYFRHPQAFTIQLYAPGSNNTVNNYWYIGYTNDSRYGQGMFAKVTSDPNIASEWRLDLSNNITIVNEWLGKTYDSISPLYYTQAEASAPRPTHVRVRIGDDWMREIPIDEIVKPITNVTATVVQGHPVRLEFFNRTANGDMELGLASLTMRI